jgi:ubiquinone/menaquinone biosynthesis C-methylase UbiE
VNLPEEQEIDRIQTEYARRDALGLSNEYTYTNPAFLFHMQERERAILQILRDEKINLSGVHVLEVGCGTGHILQRFSEFGANKTTGIDLMETRIRVGKRDYPHISLQQGNAGHLPYNDDSFGMVMQFMCISSVLDPIVRQQIADEMWRVLRPGGAILFYDLKPVGFSGRISCMACNVLCRMFGLTRPERGGKGGGHIPEEKPTPIQALSITEVRKLFSRGTFRCRSVSLNFNLARLSEKTHLLATILSCFSWLRTHNLAIIRKPVGNSV